ncbi:MogA/MoaB family molybdenum cofactor biosynthesis protein [Corynebacterium tapiri]|uniref:MogA/MoaB family molybdenum cofactor biosynthesis protein n=1 Tax=Corynebacterium tapiri TaxID=1448266 RepID=A0A5C4U3G1_9CORY|nr:MogA/MoaB family molybdenum cofactor biosynthesis protein [Corynebacterium tapiri]TNL97401.1 MogA/MoaB family molybdenum cofactor biosynthesis protein [Corynebacterium tapiri]
MSSPRAQVVVASTRAAAGTYADRSGPIAVDFLRSQGFDTPDALVVADADITTTVADILQDPHPPRVLLTSGGTGITPDDQTVEAVQPHLERELPGIVHAFWELGRQKVPTAIVSRAVAGVTKRTFVMTLPGSTGGVKDGCSVLQDVLTHIVDQLEGIHEH